ncbi:DUF3311 domain-containing protein [Fodinisporobacter ferrooxydans]|uniref:DUF3311 domain-containing protein n=1 Tax=Fodinisporobacter ferrooxydans TaxID=2901836 RepID=A0ABY4CHS4_9BACL|nr:DUF3311 domain-containing protein [Alicyclobacillaceae bacterium MYW30-H2]
MNRKKRVPKYWIFLLVPYIWDVLLIPFINTSKIHPFGIPFLLLWMLLGVIVVSIFIGVVYYLDIQSNHSAEQTIQMIHHVESKGS